MFLIHQGKLKISSSEAQRNIITTAAAELTQMRPKKIAKLFYFCRHFNQIENPVTVLAWGKSIMEIHPGHFRLIAAYLRGEETIDAVFVHNDLEGLKTFAKDITAFRNPILQKQLGADWWQITVEKQRHYANNKNYEKMNLNFQKSFEDEIFKKYGSITWYHEQKTVAEYNLKNTNKRTFVYLNKEFDFYKTILEISQGTQIKTAHKIVKYPTKKSKNKMLIKSEDSNLALERGSWNIDHYNNRRNSLDDWKKFFEENNLYLADLSDNHFNKRIEPISIRQKNLKGDTKWINKKYLDHVKNGYCEDIETFEKEYREVQLTLQKYDKSIANLLHNKVWELRGFEYLAMIKSGYINGIINHASSIVRNSNLFETHPGRHSSFARRFLKQSDIHFLTAPKSVIDIEKNSYIKIISKIETVDEILENLPKGTHSPRLWLQGTHSVWPFIVTELNLSKNDWGTLDDNNQITITKDTKEQDFKIYKKWAAKVLKNYNFLSEYRVTINLDRDQIENYFLAFMLTNKTEDSIFKKR